jgi:hypothetical protein
MTTVLRVSVAALALAGASLFASAPANADRFGFGYGSRGGIGFSYETGGYCDSVGCPVDFWDYPIAYCPVYFDGDWHSGPFYYRYISGDYYYWIRGDWRRDEWEGDRPDDACVGRFGPPRDYDFYANNGFIWLDAWRFRFFHHHHHHDHDHDGGHDHDHNGNHDHHGDNGGWDRGGDRGMVWDHGGDHNPHSGGTTGDPGRPATGSPAPLGGSPGAGGGLRDHLNGGEFGGRHHDGGSASPSGNAGADRGGFEGHRFDAGGRGGTSAPPPSSPAPSSPPPSSAPPSSSPAPSGGHHDFSDGGGQHHSHTP